MTEGRFQSPTTTQDFGIEKHGFKLPPPFYPRSASRPITPNDSPDTKLANGVLEHPQQISTEGKHDAVAEQDLKVNHHPLRAEASSFDSHPVQPDGLPILTTGSLETGLGPAQTSPIPTQSSPTVASPPQTQTTGQGYGHAHNVSFYPPPPMSPNDPSSPVHSVYQGYTYTPSAYAYPQHTHSASQNSQSYQPNPEACVPPGQQYGAQSPFYNNNPPFPTIGTHLPLTPSATPLESDSHPSNLSNGYRAAKPEYGSDIVSQHPEQLGHHRSVSRSTLKSDSIPYRPSKVQTASTQPAQYDAYRTDDWRTMELSAMQHARVNGSFDEAPLAEHLLYHFNDPMYADCRLYLIHRSKRFAKTEWALSCLLLAQSSKLRDIITISKRGEDGIRVLELSLNDRFVTPTSVESALRVLYGMPSDTFRVSSHDENSTADLSMMRMKESLAYAATGCLLYLKDVVLRGLQVASELISWESLEAALSFGLESGLERESNASSAVIPAYSTLLARDSDPSPSSHTLFTPSSSGDPNARQSSRSSKSSSSLAISHRLPPQSAYDLLMHCLDFIINNFPSSWELDLSARPLADVDRLPVTAESRSPLSKSRLSRIQFGSHPSEATLKSADRNVLISTVLLSIPFEWLDHLLVSIGEPIGRHIGSIIKERERRRQIVLQSKSVPWSERIAAKDSVWAHAGFEEFIKAGDDGKTSLSRRYTGIALDSYDEHTKAQ